MISHFFTAPFVRSPKWMESPLSRCPGKDLIRALSAVSRIKAVDA